MDYILEKAKNGEYTCKYRDKYLYSKYNPSRVNVSWNIDDSANCYILLGMGLGYEYQYLLSLTSKPVYVIEYEDFFKNYIYQHTSIDPQYLDESDSIGDFKNAQILINSNLIQPHFSKYNHFLMHVQKKCERMQIVVLAYGVIAKDCVAAFEKLGYDVIYLTTDQFEEWLNHTKILPKFFFSINFQHWLAELADQLRVPYISWTVDTPSYPLFISKILSYQFSYAFHYDELVVNKLKEQGVQKVFYLPVAANVERFDTVQLDSQFSTDVTFVGHSCGHNEYENYVKNNLTNDERFSVDKLIQRQLMSNNFIIKEEISSILAKKIISTPSLIIPEGLLDMMSETELASLLIGRQHSYIERSILVKLLEKSFDFKVYGDDYWEKVNILSYEGLANHYDEMPKIFKESKINVNLIRSFVDSGLPMRVFDVLGCGGFLITNAKRDIYKYFKDGEHLVVFHSFDDLLEKITYYLENEEERKRIARNGYEEIKKYHT